MRHKNNSKKIAKLFSIIATIIFIASILFIIGSEINDFLHYEHFNKSDIIEVSSHYIIYIFGMWFLPDFWILRLPSLCYSASTLSCAIYFRKIANGQEHSIETANCIRNIGVSLLSGAISDIFICPLISTIFLHLKTYSVTFNAGNMTYAIIGISLISIAFHYKILKSEVDSFV